jgi:hypothetical protein
VQTIDVHDLPEPLAQAIAAMVESVRKTVKPPTPRSANGERPTVGEILKPILDAAAALPREPGPPHEGQESEIAQGVVEKFKRQGLKL